MKRQVLARNIKYRAVTRSCFAYFKALSVVLILLFVCQLSYAQTDTTGTWTALTNQEPNGAEGGIVLLTDGTVLVHNDVGGADSPNYGTGWDKLSPGSTGSYINGTWATGSNAPASMINDRLFFASQVLPSGKVFVAGGEYGTGEKYGEIYDPVANTWSNVGTTGEIKDNGSTVNFYDANSEILPNGNVIVGAQLGPDPSYDCIYYIASSNTFAVAPTAPLNHDEACWLKLPDSSILFIGIDGTSSCRFIPKTSSWIADGKVPVNIWNAYSQEMGTATLLPNGQGLFLGANGNNALYTPSGNTNKGTWANATSFPSIAGSQVSMADAPSAMMPNGHILLAASPNGTSSNNEFLSPIYFLEYNYLSGTFTQVTSDIPGTNQDDFGGISCYLSNMMVLPSGHVLMGIDQEGSTQWYDYTPGGKTIVASGIPVIKKIIPDGCPNYKLTGTGFNGISEGAAYGDDWQMYTNFPIVRLTNAAGTVYYAKTTNWNRIGAVMTGSALDTVVFTPPALPAGTYSLVVVANGIASSPIIFTTLQVSAFATNIQCNGSTGSATASVTGGLIPYTYSWANTGGSGATGTGLSAGTYTVTVTDNNNCTATATVILTQPATKVTASTAVISNASCSANNGSALSAVSGGTVPYTYIWTGGATNSTVSGLAAGTYTLNVTDNNGCSASSMIVITQSSGLNASANTLSNVNCNGSNDGSIIATIKGGTAPFTYSWTDGGNTATISGLSAGIYTVIITDANGCSGTASATITEPSILTVSDSVVSNVTCAGNNGSASSTVSGGTAPYTYVWTGGGTNTTVNGLGVGNYVLSVTDHNGCSASGSVTIIQTSGLSASANIISNINCNGATDGSITANVSGGIGPFTYAWTGGGTTDTLSGLSAGTYIVTVTDSNGCSGTASASITQPGVLNVSGNVLSNVGCAGNTGSASSTVSGGIAPYTYSWTGGVNTPTITGLSVGTYTLNVTDANGCGSSTSITITQAPSLSVSANAISNINCNGSNDGSIKAIVTGGIAPFTYFWTGGGTTDTLSGLSAGTYTVTVTDASGCSGTASTSVTQPVSAVSIVIDSAINISCNGEATGGAITTASGGTPPYTYSWTPSGGVDSSVSNLAAGIYTITVTDSKNCITTASITITQPAGMVVTVDSIAAKYGCNGGAGVAIASGGVAPYTYNWSPGGGTNDTIAGKCWGIYCCTITDNNGCSKSICVNVVSDTSTGIATIANSAKINIYPDPSTGLFTVAGVSQGQVIEVYDALGQLLNSVQAVHATIYFNITDQANGMYLVRILSKDGSLVSQKKIFKTQ